MIHICHIFQHNHVLKFMYKPAVDSVIKLIPFMFNSIPFKYYDVSDQIKINHNDILIWVGNFNINFRELKNIYTIHFHLEPTIIHSGSDELWTYSKYMVDEYKKVNLTAKFIPIIYDDNVPKITYNTYTPKLTFIGTLSKSRIIKTKLISVQINNISNLWTDHDFNEYIINHADIFLNLNSDIGKSLASIRINKLLSHKCIIISEKTNDMDEELYKDIVFFKELNEIGDFYKSLLSKSREELEMISENAYQKFISIFSVNNAPNIIFQNKT